MEQLSLVSFMEAAPIQVENQSMALIGDLMPRSIFRTCTNLFGLMEEAEHLIAEFQAEFPEHSDRIWNSFKILCPTNGMSELAREVYIAHVRELLTRVVNNSDTRPGTHAEMLVVMMKATLAHPVPTEYMCVYDYLWEKVFGKKPPHDFVWHEPYKGFIEQELSPIQRKLTDENRRL